MIDVNSLRGGSIGEIVARNRMAPAYEPLVWEYEGLRIIEEVRYSAAKGPSVNRGVIPLDDMRPDLSPVAKELKRIFRNKSLGGVDSETGLPRPLCDKCANNVSAVVQKHLGEGYTVEIANLGASFDPNVPYLRVVDPTGKSPYVVISTAGFHDTVKITSLEGVSYYIDAWTYLYTKRSVKPLTWNEYIGKYWLDADDIIERSTRPVGSTHSYGNE